MSHSPNSPSAVPDQKPKEVSPPEARLRPPAYPIITHDPYFCIWSFADELYDEPTKHWTGRNHPLEGIIRVDGQEYQFLGRPFVPPQIVVPTSAQKVYSARYTFNTPPPNWNTLEHDDYQWRTAHAPFGVKFNHRVERSVWSARELWMRREFSLDTPDFENLYLNILHDDEVEVYLNGHLAYAWGPCGMEDYTYRELPPAVKSHLRQGRNVMAIRCRNPNHGVGFIDVGLSDLATIANPVPNAVQHSVRVRATQTHYEFAAGGVDLAVTFTSPLLPDDLETLARPASYVTFRVQANDGAPHEVQIRFSASGQIAVNQPDQETKWRKFEEHGLTGGCTGTRTQEILSRKGDNVRMDWGYLYLAAPGDTAEHTIDGETFAFTLPMGAVGGQATERHLILAYDDIYSVKYFHENLRAWWRRDEEMTAGQMLADTEEDYTSLMLKCRDFDEQLYQDTKAAGGEQYAQLCELSYRQAIAAHKLVAHPDGTPMFFSKENFSNGSIGTVDVTYPSAPLFLLYNPDLLKAMMEFIFDYSESGRWTKPFAAHDLGTYPIANGQTYPEDMPVEECGNMLIMTAAIAEVEGNAEYARRHWGTLKIWAEYLKKEGFDPANQLCTDDFAGHLTRNANLSVKAILGLASFGVLAAQLGFSETAHEYTHLAKSFAMKWMKMADDTDHYPLTFGKKGSWSQKYNLIWDKLLDFNIFPPEVVEKEIKYYLKKQQPYGLPLDSRKHYTKSDWLVWLAAMARKKEDFDALMQPLYHYINETPTRVPICDWYDTLDAKQVGFQARSVVGGHFMKLLERRLLDK